MNGRVLTSPLLANFVASDISGPPPMTVRFINTSYGDYEHALWDFGDGATSTLENPAHIYTRPGVYTVTLTVRGDGGHDTFAKTDYIAVLSDDSRSVDQEWQPLFEQAVGFARFAFEPIIAATLFTIVPITLPAASGEGAVHVVGHQVIHPPAGFA